jgi:hypothetical protein
LIDISQKAQVEQWQAETVAAIQAKQWVDANNLWNNMTLAMIEWAGWVNPADIRIFGFPDFDDGTNVRNSLIFVLIFIVFEPSQCTSFHARYKEYYIRSKLPMCLL